MQRALLEVQVIDAKVQAEIAVEQTGPPPESVFALSEVRGESVMALEAGTIQHADTDRAALTCWLSNFV